MGNDGEKRTWIPGQNAPLPPTPSPPSSYFSQLSKNAKKNLTITGRNFFKGLTEGAGLLGVPFTIGFSEPLRETAGKALAWNLAYFAMATASDFLHDNLQYQAGAIDADNKPIHPISYSTHLMSLALGTGFLTVNGLIFVHFLIRNSIDNLAIASAANKDKTEEEDKHKCECEFKPTIPGLLNDPFTNFFGMKRLTELRFIPYVGWLAGGIYGSLYYGNALVQLRLPSMCLDHRREYVKDHVFAVMGYGASMLLTTQIAYMMMEEYAGRDGFLLYDALFCMVYQLYIIHSITSGLDYASDPLGFDPTYLDRRAVDNYLADLGPLISNAFTDESPSWVPTDKILAILRSRVIRTWTQIDLRSLDQFLQNPNIKAYVKLIQPTLIKIIEGVSEIPGMESVKVGKRLEKWLKPLGIKSEGLDLARTLWEIVKKGYFYEDFLNPIANSINHAAGVKMTLKPFPKQKGTTTEIILPANPQLPAPQALPQQQAAAPTLTLRESQQGFTMPLAKDDNPKARRRVVVDNSGSEILNDYDPVGNTGAATTRTVITNPKAPAPIRYDKHGKPLYAQTISSANGTNNTRTFTFSQTK